MLQFFFFIVLFSSSLHADFHTRFESFEHVIAGDRISLPGISDKLLHLKNGLALSFGEIIAMGDFYGVPDFPIARGKSSAKRSDRFMAAFHALADNPNSVSEATKIIAAIHQSKPGEDQTILWNCLTGGACSGMTWWLEPGRYLLLVASDYDHFGHEAVTAYITGHELALQAALSGDLEQAYALDAFACHFLTDRFSSGHIRTPRAKLPEHVTPGVIGSLLAHFMHNEKSSYGLHVHNQRGDTWVAYGDGKYLDPKNEDNLRILQEALQLSVNDVYAAFSTASLPITHSPLALIPEADEKGPQATLDIAPLFYWDTNTETLMRRENLGNPYDHHWTDAWIGWSTLAALKMMNL